MKNLRTAGLQVEIWTCRSPEYEAGVLITRLWCLLKIMVMCFGALYRELAQLLTTVCFATAFFLIFVSEIFIPYLYIYIYIYLFIFVFKLCHYIQVSYNILVISWSL
jgi:hypothetical protein